MFGRLFGNKKQEAAQTDAARQQVQEAVTQTQREMDARFSNYEELVKATLVELQTRRIPSSQRQLTKL